MAGIKKYLIFTVWCLTIPAISAAMPIELYKVVVDHKMDAYKLAAKKQWPVYFIYKNIILASKDVGDNPAERSIISSEMVYKGDTRNLSWVRYKGAVPGPSALDGIIFEAGGTYLVEREKAKSFMLSKRAGALTGIRRFVDQPLNLSSDNSVIDPNLEKDAAIASIVDQIDTAKVRADVEGLQALVTRYIRADNHAAVAEWLRQEFLSMGISDVQVDTFIFTPWWGGGQAVGYNVIASITGLCDTSITYMVCGHYDSVLDLYFPPDTPSVYFAPGADDNASGTAAVLEMARVLAANRPNCNVKFLALDAEEMGGIGGYAFVDTIKSKEMNVGLVMNFDMIGARCDEYSGEVNDSIFVSRIYPGCEKYAYLLGKMASFYGEIADTPLVAVYTSNDLNSSDSWEFYQNGYNVTYGTEYVFSDDWHQPSDSITHMNIRYCTSIIKAGLGMMATLSNYPRVVKDIEVSYVGDNAIRLQWKANEEPGIVGYDIGYGTSSGNYTGHTSVSGLSVELANLTDAGYYISVRAVNDLGRKSIEAQEIEVQVPTIKTVLIVDDDGGALDACGESWTKYIEAAVADLGYRYSTVVVGQYYAAVLGYFPHYPMIIWNLGPDYDERVDSIYQVISDTNQTILMEYLDAGGKLWMIGQRYLWTSNPDTSVHPNLWSDYLRLSRVNGWINKPCSTITGVPGDTIGDGFLDPIFNGYGRLCNNYWTESGYGCQLVPDPTESTAVGFMTNNDGGFVAVRTQNDSAGGYRFVFTAFPFEAVSTTELRDTLAARIIAWLMPQTPDYQAPESPGGFSAVQQDSQVVCLWQSNTEADLAGYNIYRALLDGLPQWAKIAGVAAPETSFADCTIKDDSTYCYAVTSYDNSYPYNESQRSDYVTVTISGLGVGVGDKGRPTAKFYLDQIKPNPVTRSAAVDYQLPVAGKVSLKIYNVAGQIVKTLVNAQQGSGHYTVYWDGTNEQGDNVNSGVYLCRLWANDMCQTRRMVVLR
jgi:hypothetical protein